MKTFKEYISEAFSLAPVVDLTTNGTDVKIQEVKNQLNRNIDLTLRQNFQTVDEALSKLSKILAMYNLDIPRVEFGDLKQNSLRIPVGLKGIVWDEFDGKMEQLNPYYLKFSYTLNDGLYKCSAELE